MYQPPQSFSAAPWGRLSFVPSGPGSREELNKSSGVLTLTQLLPGAQKRKDQKSCAEIAGGKETEMGIRIHMLGSVVALLI